MNLYPGQRYVPECIRTVVSSGRVKVCDRLRCEVASDCSFSVNSNCSLEAVDIINLDLGSCVNENVPIIIGAVAFGLFIIGALALFTVLGRKFIVMSETDSDSVAESGVATV